MTKGLSDCAGRPARRSSSAKRRGAWQLLRHDTTQCDGLYTRHGCGNGLDLGVDIWHLASWDIYGWLTISRFSYGASLYLYEEDDWTLMLPLRGDTSCGFLGLGQEQAFQDQTPSFIIEKTALKACHIKNVHLTFASGYVAEL